MNSENFNPTESPDRIMRSCPFCGRQNTLVIDTQSDDVSDEFLRVVCDPHRQGCGAEGPLVRVAWKRGITLASEAVRLWNERADNVCEEAPLARQSSKEGLTRNAEGGENIRTHTDGFAAFGVDKAPIS